MSPYDPFGLFIAGRWQAAADGATFDVRDPSVDEIIGAAPQAGRTDTLAAIDAAQSAFGTWSRTDPWRRTAVLRRIARRMRNAAPDLARWITLETGKPLPQAAGEVATAADYFDWFADAALQIIGQVIPARERGTTMVTTREPVGVVAALTSWNFPINLPARKIAAALAAGCTVICRPSEEAPGAAMAFFEAMIDDDLPAGAVNLLTGLHGPIVPTLMADYRVRKVSFTGSTAVGRSLIEASAQTVKRLSLELGGHAAAVVFDDADIDDAALQLASFKFRNAGQICISPSRFYVQEQSAARFTDAVCRHVTGLVVGNGFDPATHMGPLINRRRLDAVEDLVGDAIAHGATVRAGGRRPASLNHGFFFEPTVLSNVPERARVMNEEPFGPILPIATFRDEAEVVDRVNRLEYGLANYIFTRSEHRARSMGASLQSGMIGINTALIAAVEAPFGGMKASGFGTEGGTRGIDEYLSPKYVKSVVPE